MDKLVNHGQPTRSLKSAKTMLVASRSLDKVAADNPGFDRVFGHTVEIVPVSNPVTLMGPGQKLVVKLLLKGQPLVDSQVSFIPQRIAHRELPRTLRMEDKRERRGSVHFQVWQSPLGRRSSQDRRKW